MIPVLGQAERMATDPDLGAEVDGLMRECATGAEVLALLPKRPRSPTA